MTFDRDADVEHAANPVAVGLGSSTVTALSTRSVGRIPVLLYTVDSTRYLPILLVYPSSHSHVFKPIEFIYVGIYFKKAETLIYVG